MDFNLIQALIADDMAKVDKKIHAQLDSNVVLINQLGFYIVQSGGKRLRPILVLLAANALHYKSDGHITAAAFIEFIHTATLLHDDVVDESDLRRGKATANSMYGNAASVLVGDYIYTRSFQMMTELRSLKILDLMSKATNVIAEGEVLQLMKCNDSTTTEADYMQVIYSKTARLFEVATQIGAILADAPVEIEKAMQEYGRYLGTAFQLIDDVMDYTSKNNEMGKNTGDDLAEGKPTLPLIHAMQHGNEQQRLMIKNAIEEGGNLEMLNPILACMEEVGSLEYTRNKATEEAQKAISALYPVPESQYKEALKSLALLAVNRNK